MKNPVSKRIILVVSNDLEGDQRLHKMAMSLQKKAWDPVLTGRILADSRPLSRPYPIRRLKLLFSKGPLFYACFNIRIFLHLLFIRADLFVANDLDTLAAVYIASVIRRKPMIYDSHEYFTQLPELINRPRVQRIWKFIERRIQAHIKYVITVNESIAEIFSNEYQNNVVVIKNLPLANSFEPLPGKLPKGFTDKPILIYQGAVNVGRGLEEMIEAMELLSEFNLLIVGGGDRFDSLKELVETKNLSSRVYFTGRIAFESMAWYTGQAKIGLSLEQDIGLNYRLSLPNKLFDYMRAGLPVIASDLPEIRKLVEDVEFGLLVNDFSASSLSVAIRSVWQNKDLYARFKNNALKKASNYWWEGQEGILYSVYEKALG